MSAVEPLSVIASSLAPSASSAKPRDVEGVFAALVGAATPSGKGEESAGQHGAQHGAKPQTTGAKPETVPATPDPAQAALAALAAAPGQPQPPAMGALSPQPQGEPSVPQPAGSDDETASAPTLATDLAPETPAAPALAVATFAGAAGPADAAETDPDGAENARGPLVSALAKSLDPSARDGTGPGAPPWAGRTPEGEQAVQTPGARVSEFVAGLKAQSAAPPPAPAPAPSEEGAAFVPADGQDGVPPPATAATPAAARVAAAIAQDRPATPAPAAVADLAGAAADEEDAPGPSAALTKSTPGRERSGGPAAAALEATAAAAARREGAAVAIAPVVEAQEADLAASAPVETVVHGARAGAQGAGAAAAHPALAHAAAGSADAIAQIGAQMLRRLDGRAVRFELSLNPAELGAVSVSLEIDRDGRVSAAMAFDNAQTAADMRARSDELRRMLEQAGFTLADDALSFAERESRDDGRGSGDGSRQAGRAFSESADLVDTADQGWRLERRFRTGGVDVRI